MDTILKKLLDTHVDVATQLKRLNENLEAGRVNLRTHHPLCTVPLKRDYSVAQLEAMGQFLNRSIESGALVLPPKDDDRTAAPNFGVTA